MILEGEKVIGIDVGGTSIKFGIISREGKAIREEKIPMDAKELPDVVIDKIVEKCAQLKEDIVLQAGQVVKIGVGVPGAVSLDGGTTSYPPNLPLWKVVRLGSEIKNKFEKLTKLEADVKVENDANLAALAECYYGAGKNYDDFVMVTLGTGVGGGIIINNKIFRGTTGAAAELGHYTIDKDNDHIHAGIPGTMEALIGWKQIASYAEQHLENYTDSILKPLIQSHTINTKDLFEAAKKNDALALSVWKYVGETLGVGLGSLVSILDIRKFIIGGGVAGAFQFFAPYAERTIKSYSALPMRKGISISKAELGNKAGVVGAASLCLH